MPERKNDEVYAKKAIGQLKERYIHITNSLGGAVEGECSRVLLN